MERWYLVIDLKSFFASVECVERGLDPMTTLLVVADASRTDKTICLAVTPAMKALGVKNRCRMFEIPKNVNYIVATPRMQKYIDYAADIYAIYLEYIAKEDIHVYSIDECFIDVTSYLALYKKTPKEMAVMLMDEIANRIGIRATCGIGTNLYLAKIALDITAKHAPDFIGILTEQTFIETMWDHKPLTDFWRIGTGTAQRLERIGLSSMRDIAHANEDTLCRIFGIDAELLIDHAWGRETATMADIKAYRTSSTSFSSGQVLMRNYSTEEARLIVKEMSEALTGRLIRENAVTGNVGVWIGYDSGLKIPSSNGAITLDVPTSSEKGLRETCAALFDKIVVPKKPIRRLNISYNQISPYGAEQLTLLDDPLQKDREHSLQQTVVGLKQKYGKNAVLKGMDLEQAATTRERNGQIGGHKSGT